MSTVKAYTYVINSPDGRRYYGVKYSANCQISDLWTTYFTSSKEIKKLIKIYGKESFTYEIRKTFYNTNKARLWEQEVLRRLKVESNDLWINKTSSNSIPPMYGDENPAKKLENREKISAGKIGLKRPDSAKRMKENHPLWDPECNAKFRQTRKDKIAQGLIVPFKGKVWPTGKDHHRYGQTYLPFVEMNKKEYTCPHCQKIGKGPGMKRYHFDNCKTLSKINLQPNANL